MRLSFFYTFALLGLAVVDKNRVHVDSKAADQDYKVYGRLNQFRVPMDLREIQQINSNCFSGVGFVTCLPEQPEDDSTYQYQMDYYKKLSDNVGALFCLNCCSTAPDMIDYWDLHCSFDLVTRLTLNLFGYEFRMARKKTRDDFDVITCPLKRSFCTYEDNGNLIDCDLTTPVYEANKYLVGATVTFEVEQYSENNIIWNGVTKCSAIAYESPDLPADGDVFYQKIIMNHPTIEKYFWEDEMKGAIFFVILVFFFHYILKFCRRKSCIICHNPLVYSMEVCMMCKFVGATPPDPVLLEALEAKGIMIQGVPTERFPGSTILVTCIRLKYTLLKDCFMSIFLAILSCVKYLVNRVSGREVFIMRAKVNSEVTYVEEIPAGETADGQRVEGIDQGEMKDIEMSNKSIKSKKKRSKYEHLPRLAHMEKYDLDFMIEAIEATDLHIEKKKKDIYSNRAEKLRLKREAEEALKYNLKHNPDAIPIELKDKYKTLGDIEDPIQILSLEKGERVNLGKRASVL